MKLITTTVAGNFVRLRIADDPDDSNATEWIDPSVIPGELVVGDRKLSEHQARMPLAATQVAALRRAQNAIAAEITRLSAYLDG